MCGQAAEVYAVGSDEWRCLACFPERVRVVVQVPEAGEEAES